MSIKIEEDSALDKLLEALDDDPLLNEALGRSSSAEQTKSKDSEKKKPKATPPPEDEDDEDSIRRAKAAAGFSSYALVESEISTSGLSAIGNEQPSPKALPAGGKLKPLGKAKTQKLGALPSLGESLSGSDPTGDSKGGGLKPLTVRPSLAALEEGPASVASGGPSPIKKKSATEQEQEGQVLEQMEPPASVIPFDEVQLMPFTFCRELVSKGGIAPRRRWGHSVHVYGGSLYCYGGNTPNAGGGGGSTHEGLIIDGGEDAAGAATFQPTNDFFESDLHTLVWDPVFCSKGQLPKPRAQHAAAVSDALGKLIIHGGNGPLGALLGDTHVYDFSSQEWSAPASLNKMNNTVGAGGSPSERADHTMTLVGDNLYIFGGRVPRKSHVKGGAATSLSSELWVLDLTRWRWKHLKNHSQKGKKNHNNVKDDDGGGGGEEQKDLSVNISAENITDDDGNAQPQVSTHPCKRAGHAACAVGSWLVIHGGQGAHGDYLSDSWCYNVATEGPWLRLDDGTVCEFPRYRHQLVNAGTSLLALGGATQYQGGERSAIGGGGVDHSGFSSVLNLTLMFTGDEELLLGEGVASGGGRWNLAAATRWLPHKIHGNNCPATLRGFGAARHNGFCCIFGGAVAGAPVANNIRRILLTDGIPQAKTSAKATLLYSLQHLLDSGIQADLKMECRGKVYMAHKFILSLRCPKFLEAVLQCHNVNSSSTAVDSSAAAKAAAAKEIPIYGLEGNRRAQGLPNGGSLTGEQLALFLGYVYTGRLNLLNSNSTMSSTVPPFSSSSASKSVSQQQQQTSKEEEELDTLQLLLSELATEFHVTHLCEVLNVLNEKGKPCMPKQPAGAEGEEKKKKKSQRKVDDVQTIPATVTPKTKTAGERHAQANELGTATLLADLRTLSDSTNGVTVTLHVTDPHNSAETLSVVCHHTVLMNRSPFFMRLLKPLFSVAPVAPVVAPPLSSGGDEFAGALQKITTTTPSSVAPSSTATTSSELNGVTAKVFTSRRGRRAEVTLSLPVASVRPVLKYLYTGEDVVPPEAALPVMMAANKLELSGLQAICESMVARDEVTADSACAIVAMAMRYNANHLYEHAVLVAAYCFTSHHLKTRSDTFAALPQAVQAEIERAAKEMAGKHVVTPTPSTELKDRGHYTNQFEKSSQPGAMNL